MSMMPETITEREFSDGVTKQSFKDQTDINKLLARAAKGESLSHLQRHGAVYGDFTAVDDLLTAHATMERGFDIFRELPAELRKEFYNDPRAFFNFVNDPANAEKLPELLPALAKPGKQLPDVRKTKETVTRAEERDQEVAAAKEQESQGDGTDAAD